MTTLLVFAVALLAAVLVSDYASRSLLSTSVLFLAVGVVAGRGALDLLPFTADDVMVGKTAEVALFVILFTDGMHVGFHDLRRAWRLPGRALLLGMPLTAFAIAALAHWLVGFGWLLALLVGAALSPTDPVIASALFGRDRVPARLQHLLNVESGLNDGLALPAVIVLLGMVSGHAAAVPVELERLVLGVVLGVTVPWLVLQLEGRWRFAAVDVYRPILAFAVGLLVYGLTASLQANPFLAAFAAGITVTSTSSAIRDAFREFGEILAELLKLGALLLFGALVSPAFIGSFGPSEYVFALLVLVLARPVALALALLGSGLGRRQWLVAAWFGPRGFASVVYGLLILHSGAPGTLHAFHVMALVIAASIVVHSSTDVLVARWLDDGREPSHAGRMGERAR